MESLTREQFHRMAPRGRLVPVYRELAADMETPVSLYLKLRGQGPSFLLESVEKAERMGRYSILGAAPRRQVISRGRRVEIIDDGRSETRELPDGEDPLDVVAAEMARYQPVALPGETGPALPRFFGGAVGYLGYDLARFFERLPATARDELKLADLHLLITDTLVILDHLQHRLLVFANTHTPPGADLDVAYDDALSRLDAIETRLAEPLPPEARRPARPERPDRDGPQAGMARDEFEAAARRARESISAGEALYVTLSQRLSRATRADPLLVYRALRRLNPLPYMYLLELGGSPPVTIIGSAPDTLARLEGTHAELRPVSGMRPRGQTEAEDRALEQDLLADREARAKHVLLVDVARNDLGCVARFGTMAVPELMVVERHTQSMHLASRVRAELRDGQGPIDLLRAAFPAGRVTGAHKVRAMQLAEELEGRRRGAYGGAVGYVGFNGSMDMCIGQRIIVIQGDAAYVQAGAGITADTAASGAWESIMNKVQGLMAAIDVAEQGL